MTREELEQQIRGMIGPRYWVLDTLMELIDQYTGDIGDGYFCNMHDGE